MTTSSILANISKIVLVIGLIFLFVKLIRNIPKKEEGTRGYDKVKVVLYNLHKVGPILATILAFIHGLIIPPINQTYVWTGWLLGITMVLLSGIGIFMGFKTKWVPYTEEENKKYLCMRIVKWILTGLMLVALALHYLY